MATPRLTPGRGRARGLPPAATVVVRVGIGTDQHAIDRERTRPLVLAGVKIPGAPGLRAHSDGDVVLHAVFNAISSALGQRSIGFYHHDRDRARRGVASSQYLDTTSRMLRTCGFAVNNLSVAIECSTPRLEPHIPRMCRRLARLLDCPVASVGITASTGEGLSAYGRGEGILAQAIVSLHRVT